MGFFHRVGYIRPPEVIQRAEVLCTIAISTPCNLKRSVRRRVALLLRVRTLRHEALLHNTALGLGGDGARAGNRCLPRGRLALTVKISSGLRSEAPNVHGAVYRRRDQSRAIATHNKRRDDRVVRIRDLADELTANLLVQLPEEDPAIGRPSNSVFAIALKAPEGSNTIKNQSQSHIGLQLICDRDHQYT